MASLHELDTYAYENPEPYQTNSRKGLHAVTDKKPRHVKTGCSPWIIGCFVIIAVLVLCLLVTTLVLQFTSSEQVDELTRRLNEANDEINTLKALALATANLINKTDALCGAQQGSPLSTCESLGTALNPALSCEQIKEACDVPSGVFYVQGGSETFLKVYCDMESFVGVWTRFGKGDMSAQWNYVDEDEQTTTINVFSDTDILNMQRLNFTEFRILTDVTFRLQADDSVNPSSLSVTLLPALTPVEISIVGSADHTHLLFDEEDDQLECFGASSNRCGYGNTPSVGSKSRRLFIRSAFFSPRENGATAHSDVWARNKYTWNGSYYFVLAK